MNKPDNIKYILQSTAYTATEAAIMQNPKKELQTLLCVLYGPTI